MKVFTIQGHFARYRSMADKTLQLTFETQEPDPGTVSRIQESLLMPGFIAFKPDEFRKQEIEEIDKIKIEYDDNRKTQSWRMRAVLYKNWEQHNEGFDSFEMYYNHYTEKYINHLKSKLLP
jgi:hypothetical protein